ncbi:Putative zn(2)-C6 fungal-type DNA-binding domain, fungal transcription factor [Septoria linicola]|uniref:Zn(2)-C6 fungal-type DNA-binding domain, fungal transcription factor n=1 Tax=Septoria linicola TaxID=215465 RepID=A0A9Q9AN85_9PEZI|nr:putative zn(2)-C6 fungal-type DNA-binding domain, fungal transcription factor [Septoria linicola]USW51234.1 Putative zn(2)-C6 fungal-type DNA-binding domain, fungal transcription factor [Septoria linicola]
MAQEASERACDRCRERRVKCDKTQPTCLRCEKLGKPCPGYDKKRKFVDEGVTLRKKYQGSNDRPSSDEKAAASPRLYQATVQASSSSNSAQPDVRSPATTLAGTIPPLGASSLAQPPSTLPAFDAFNNSILAQRNSMTSGLTHGLPITTLDPTTEAMLLADPPVQIPLTNDDAMLDTLWKSDNFDPEFFDLQPDAYYSAAGNTCGFLPNIPEIVDEVDQSDILLSNSASGTPLSTGIFSGSFSDSNLWAPESQLNTSALITSERDHEMAYLIRHFTESIGPWMDLFDRDKHFTHLVPLKALRDALLRNAIAAVAAKQLGRVKGRKPFTGRQFQKPSAMEVLDDSTSQIDWFYKAANYYDKAIAFSRQYLQAVSGELSNPPSPNTQLAVSMANSDDLLVAVSIFSLYESLDNLETGWLQHLAGLKSLLGAISPSQQIQNQVRPSLTIGRLASFWNFARADYQAAYLNKQRTLLDTEDLALWSSCGLELQEDGTLYKSTDFVKNDPTHCRVLAELVAHTLLWLVLRVMNYLASDENSSARRSQWDLLTRQLDHWYGNLPDTFQPCAHIRHPASGRTMRSQLFEVFFSIDVCAAAMQLYHFARILLLLHRPMTNERGVFRNRLKAYREVSTEAIKHAHEIIGIALGRPHPAIRVEMLLPLSTAGACLEENDERKVVLELLRAIEQDTGCATGLRCDELMQEWGWTLEPEGIA